MTQRLPDAAIFFEMIDVIVSQWLSFFASEKFPEVQHNSFQHQSPPSATRRFYHS